MKSWNIQPTENGWLLFSKTDDGAWWPVYDGNGFAVYPTLDAVIAEIKESK
jgi:hypothetical protein